MKYLIVFVVTLSLQISITAMQEEINALVKLINPSAPLSPRQEKLTLSLFLKEEKKKMELLRESFNAGNIVLYHVQIKLGELERFSKNIPFIIKKRVLVETDDYNYLSIEVLLYKETVNQLLSNPLIKKYKQLSRLSEYFLNA